MQKIATKVFIIASIAFGVIGILFVLSSPDSGSRISETLAKLLFITVFIILPSFALSVASKYLGPKP